MISRTLLLSVLAPQLLAADDVRVVPATVPAAGRQTAVVTVPRFGRYSLAVKSASGVALTVVDRMSGPGERNGAPGETDGRVDVFLDDGHQISHQTLLPGLSVVAKKKAATVTDDGFGVKAVLKGGGHTVATSAAGKASLTVFRRGTRVTATAPGYAPASFKVP